MTFIKFLFTKKLSKKYDSFLNSNAVEMLTKLLQYRLKYKLKKKTIKLMK